ncbi:Hypothetical predicted protein [Olea europaea subsp. europaea]|uniref:Uncharacterized protein n=1 Tax=Olea europaea subsp. europaea TaxID=158383 RepID=A0A8S0QS39_OLEEU|nr:Hypothetical predicted protein [Olea europaea subsp. europaea]
MAIVPCEPPTKIHEPSDESNLPTVARPATHSNELGDNKSEMSKGNGSKGDSIEEEIGQYQESGASERLTGQILEGRISPDLVENVKANDADDSSEFTPPPREMATRAEKGKQKEGPISAEQYKLPDPNLFHHLLVNLGVPLMATDRFSADIPTICVTEFVNLQDVPNLIHRVPRYLLPTYQSDYLDVIEYQLRVTKNMVARIFFSHSKGFTNSF